MELKEVINSIGVGVIVNATEEGFKKTLIEDNLDLHDLIKLQNIFLNHRFKIDKFISIIDDKIQGNEKSN